MLTLTQDDREIIARYPLNGSLDFLRDRLRVPENHRADIPGDKHQKAASVLLGTLMVHEAAYNLKSRVSRAQLAPDISKAFSLVLTDPFNYHRNLSTAAF